MNLTTLYTLLHRPGALHWTISVSDGIFHIRHKTVPAVELPVKQKLAELEKENPQQAEKLREFLFELCDSLPDDHPDKKVCQMLISDVCDQTNIPHKLFRSPFYVNKFLIGGNEYGLIAGTDATERAQPLTEQSHPSRTQAKRLLEQLDVAYTRLCSITKREKEPVLVNVFSKKDNLSIDPDGDPHIHIGMNVLQQMSERGAEYTLWLQSQFFHELIHRERFLQGNNLADERVTLMGEFLYAPMTEWSVFPRLTAVMFSQKPVDTGTASGGADSKSAPYIAAWTAVLKLLIIEYRKDHGPAPEIENALGVIEEITSLNQEERDKILLHYVAKGDEELTAIASGVRVRVQYKS